VTPEPFESCPLCGERIGVYEPLAVLLPSGIVLRGGLTGLHAHLAAGLVHHAACFDAGLTPE